MIKVELERVEIRGDMFTILAELSSIIHSLKANNVVPEEMIKYSVEIGLEDEKKTEKKSQEALKRLVNNGHLDEVMKILANLGRK